MNMQVNVRLPEKVIVSVRAYAAEHGFSSVQELIKEAIREKLFEQPELSKEELALVKKLVAVSEKRNLYGTEELLFRKLRTR